MRAEPTPDQLRAIEAPPGATLVVAGPGAGKTFCLIGRIGHLLGTVGISPERICAVTFTNKAAGEISSRLESDGQPEGRLVSRGTLHALCLTVLRAHPEAAGLQAGFGVADEAYQQTLLGTMGVHESYRRTLLSHFGRFRLRQLPLTPDDDGIFEEYRRRLRSRNLVDFDDIILLTSELLRSEVGIRARATGRWDALLVDEFQDLGATQYEIIKFLVESHGEVFVVGDDEQSIFGWTGADPKGLSRFREEFDVTPIVLERNRRCSVQIFEAARRILIANPSLFEKNLVADRTSKHPVRALTFETDTQEADWIVQDLRADQSVSGKPWGRYALLYRKHAIGSLLERRLLDAGIPVRTARGRALSDDRVIAEVLEAVRIVLDPNDPVPKESLARRVLPPHVVNQAQAEFGRGQSWLDALRHYRRLKRGSDDEGRKIMRLLYHVDNLPALARAHDSLPELVEALLIQRPSLRESRLELRAHDLTDPLDYPGARELAADLDQVRAAKGRVHLPRTNGLDLALAGMLASARLADLLGPEMRGPGEPKETQVGTSDLVLPDQPGLPILLFKSLQLWSSHAGGGGLRDCVTFDLETTGRRADRCEIIEIGAARVREGEIVETYRTLVKPTTAIPADATKIHGYTDSDVAEAPSFGEVWPAFRRFMGDDILVAHNALGFDLPVLKSAAAAIGADATDIPVFDTLPLARSVVQQSARLGDLAERFGITITEQHHALDDAVALVSVLKCLQDERRGRQRRTSFGHGLDWLGLALAIESNPDSTQESEVLFELSRYATLGRYGDALECYAQEVESRGRADATPVDQLVDRLGGEQLRQRLRRDKPAAQRYPISVARLSGLVDSIEAPDLETAMRELLDKAALSRSEGAETADHRVNLLTLHATKGLEFSRVYIVGVEDAELPGLREIADRLTDAVAEARRVLYVGMTRAEDRLVMTRADIRGGKPTGDSLFLDEVGVDIETPPGTA